jgi:hypothetical protein
MVGGGAQLGGQIDLLGCEYLGGCPSLGSRVLNKMELHFDGSGLTVAVAPQGLFTLAGARPVLSLTWPDITSLSASTTRPRSTPLAPGRLMRSVVNVLTMRLDLADQLSVRTSAWTMTVGVRAAAADLTAALEDLLASIDGPAPAVTAT